MILLDVQLSKLDGMSLYRQPRSQGYREPILLLIYAADISPCHAEFLAQFQVRANLVVPVLKNNELWGLLAAHHCTAPHQWQDSEIDLLRQIASQVSIALQLITELLSNACKYTSAGETISISATVIQDTTATNPVSYSSQLPTQALKFPRRNTPNFR